MIQVSVALTVGGSSPREIQRNYRHVESALFGLSQHVVVLWVGSSWGDVLEPASLREL